MSDIKMLNWKYIIAEMLFIYFLMEGFLSVKYAAWKSIPFPSRPSISDFTLAQEIRMYPYLYFQKVKMIETKLQRIFLVPSENTMLTSPLILRQSTSGLL